MGYRKVGTLEQILHVIAYKVEAWLEWQDVKVWAEEFHPGWLHIAKRSKCKETRIIYKDKILSAWRGEEDGK